MNMPKKLVIGLPKPKKVVIVDNIIILFFKSKLEAEQHLKRSGEVKESR